MADEAETYQIHLDKAEKMTEAELQEQMRQLKPWTPPYGAYQGALLQRKIQELDKLGPRIRRSLGILVGATIAFQILIFLAYLWLRTLR